jgi:hypothetical protein
MAAIFTILIYERLDQNSLLAFRLLLDLEKTNRIQTAELKNFIGNVAHDLKVLKLLLYLLLLCKSR